MSSQLKAVLQQQLFNTLNQQADGKLSGREDGNGGGFSQRKAARKYDSRSLAKYVASLQNDSKEAYDIFREQAAKSGLYKATEEPLPRIHRNYYDRYIRGTQGTPTPN